MHSLQHKSELQVHTTKAEDKSFIPASRYHQFHSQT